MHGVHTQKTWIFESAYPKKKEKLKKKEEGINKLEIVISNVYVFCVEK